MVFACQKDSFKKTYFSKVKSCEKVVDGNEGSYEVICEDTILFPEGGGQPFDTGFLDDVPVYQVLRRGPDAVHYVKTPIDVGKEVKQEVCWERRFDHMQQHSGQHLITAVINEEYKIDTTSWCLGIDVCHIELDIKSLSEKQMEHIETLANKKIQAQVPVRVKMCNPGDDALTNARTRGLPKDVVGPIRIVEIVGMEDDLCCGTHVENLIQLQAVKLLYSEKGKKNKTNLYFVVGGRVLSYFSKCLIREKKLTKILNNDPEHHADLVEKMQNNVKMTNKKLSNILKLYASEQAAAFLASSPRPMYLITHCKEGGQEFIDAFLRIVKDDPYILNTFLVLATGEKTGIVTIYGASSTVQLLGPKIVELLGGRGVAHECKFQAKVSKLGNLEAVKKLVKEQLTIEK